LSFIVFVGDRCCDHSPSSGYDQVCSLFPEAGWLSGRALEQGKITWLTKNEIDLRSVSLIFHVIYGDCSGKFLPEILRGQFPNAVIVSSAHQPVSRLKTDLAACAALQASDAIIAVSQEQAGELRACGFVGPINYIPHGVWTEAFRPKTSSTADRRTEVLLVGSFLRDWDGARYVVQALARGGIRSIALGAGAQENLAGGNLDVEVPRRVPETELAEMYDRAAVLFLPFLEATASNALLEAMAAGCPVVCPRIGSIVKEYLGYDSDSYERGRYDAALSHIIKYIQNPAEREAKKRELVKTAESFDWHRIRHRYAILYKELAERLTE
jgi:glycosyltransferase involved in cell wall biosynthesis